VFVAICCLLDCAIVTGVVMNPSGKVLMVHLPFSQIQKMLRNQPYRSNIVERSLLSSANFREGLPSSGTEDAQEGSNKKDGEVPMETPEDLFLRCRETFEVLDVNKDKRLDANDLTKALKKIKAPREYLDNGRFQRLSQY